MTRQIAAITGADGFIGRNLISRLREMPDVEVRTTTRTSTRNEIDDAVRDANAIFHLAGVNRPLDPADFVAGNVESAKILTDAARRSGRPIPIVYASSAKALDPGPYGESKKAGEDALVAYGRETGAAVSIFRLPNVFGKWCRPNYNSAVATFCHNIARGEQITIHDPASPLQLVYIDDVVDHFVRLLLSPPTQSGFLEVAPVYETSVGEVANILRGFRADRAENLIDEVGTGFKRALYATYVASLPLADFSYPIASHVDPRGAFSEMLKTKTSGQFSFFTAHPGVTRGGHWHHTKTEKFLIVQGEALFRFRHVVTGETHEIRTSGASPEIVETIPGWAHDVTNVGDGTMVALLWANEIFDRARPDTYAAKV